MSRSMRDPRLGPGMSVGPDGGLDPDVGHGLGVVLCVGRGVGLDLIVGPDLGHSLGSGQGVGLCGGLDPVVGPGLGRGLGSGLGPSLGLDGALDPGSYLGGWE